MKAQHVHCSGAWKQRIKELKFEIVVHSTHSPNLAVPRECNFQYDDLNNNVTECVLHSTTPPQKTSTITKVVYFSKSY
jgi:hypothetical protein